MALALTELECRSKESLNSKGFTQKSIYELTACRPERPGVGALYRKSAANNGGGAPESFVLIIDEINRANISKVFGELITCA